MPEVDPWSRARERAMDDARKGVLAAPDALTGVIHRALTGATPERVKGAASLGHACSASRRTLNSSFQRSPEAVPTHQSSSTPSSVMRTWKRTGT